ncbi:MAG: type II toxin-antitoxin system HicB family antitoxin [Planctomycetaceae bacterium]
MTLQVLIREERDGGYSVSVPALPGCHSQGETMPEALTNIREAAELWLEVTEEATLAQLPSDSASAELQEIEL